MRRSAFLLVANSYLLIACSSVPDFKPSKPLEEASSFHEALDLCNDYEIDVDRNVSGHAQPVKLVTLVPWIRCFEDLFLKFPEARSDEDFAMFFRALKARHDDLSQPPDTPVVDGPQMNLAVHQLVTHLHNKPLEYSKEELQIFQSQLPGYFMYLLETGRVKQGKPYLSRDVEIQNLVSEIREVKKETEGPRRLTKEQQEYCTRYRAFHNLVINVEELSRYKDILEKKAQASPVQKGESEKILKIRERVFSLKKLAMEQRARLHQEWSKLSSIKLWFKNGYCLYQ